MKNQPSNLTEELKLNLKELQVDFIPKKWLEEVSPEIISEKVDARESASDISIISQMDWAELEAEALKCKKCRLCEMRTNVVFGVGRRDKPRIVFVGEGPGADEDRVGEPFVGKAGQLLTAAINKGMGLKREDVYICNVVKCRPPENRTPLPDETAACTPYLFRQLELLNPEVIVTLGQPAQLAISGINLGITKVRGQWREWRGVRVMPTLHPAYILRNPAAKKDFWEDLQEVMRVLGIPRPTAAV
jgi:uracil-DNA glycosylase family 4